MLQCPSSLKQVNFKTECFSSLPVTIDPGGGGTPIHFLYGYVPPKGVVILKLLI